MATEGVDGGEAADHDVERVVGAAEAAWTIGTERRRLHKYRACGSNGAGGKAENSQGHYKAGGWERVEAAAKAVAAVERCAAAALLEAKGAWFRVEPAG